MVFHHIFPHFFGKKYSRRDEGPTIVVKSRLSLPSRPIYDVLFVCSSAVENLLNDDSTSATNEQGKKGEGKQAAAATNNSMRSTLMCVCVSTVYLRMLSGVIELFFPVRAPELQSSPFSSQIVAPKLNSHFPYKVISFFFCEKT